jgi:hypothetical protein
MDGLKAVPVDPDIDDCRVGLGFGLESQELIIKGIIQRSEGLRPGKVAQENEDQDKPQELDPSKRGKK